MTSTRATIARGIDAATDWWVAKRKGDSRELRNAARRLDRAVRALAGTPLEVQHIETGLRTLGKRLAEEREATAREGRRIARRSNSLQEAIGLFS